MEKPDRDSIVNVAEHILSRRLHSGDTCFLTVYQLAYLIDEQNPVLKGNLPVGGKGEGDKHESGLSLAWYIAHYLASDSRFDRQWLSSGKKDSFTFCGMTPSDKTFSMFRLKQVSQSK